MKQYVLISILALLAIACKPVKFTMEDPQGKRVTIGNGGGFSGGSIEYTIFENGQVFKFNSLTKQTKELDKLSKDIVQQIFKTYDFLNLGEINMDQPGNMNYYVIMNDDKVTKKLLWNDSNKENVDRNLRLFYKTTLKQITSFTSKQ